MEMIQLAAMPLRNAIQKGYVIITPSTISATASPRGGECDRTSTRAVAEAGCDYNYQRFREAEVRGDHGVLR
jgi:hypothetical protein